jgi:hypothetical protein
MKGYEILEQKNLQPYKEDGVKQNTNKIGVMDFLREIRSGSDSIPRFSSFMVVGVDETLYMTKPEDRLELAREIHRVLQSAAQALDRKMVEVQIICKGRLVRGDSLWLEYRGEKLPIELIFGSTKTNDVRGFHVFTTGFNLST